MRALLFQFLPLLVFSVVDAFVSDARISIATAVTFAFAQLVVTFAKTRRFDWFLVLDVVLITLLGGLSIALDNELFFKLKPAIIEGVSVLLLVLLLVAPERLLIGYFARFMPGVALHEQTLVPLKRLLWSSCGFIALHIGAVVYAATCATKETWALVSGPGFYVVLVPLAGLALAQRRRG